MKNTFTMLSLFSFGFIWSQTAPSKKLPEAKIEYSDLPAKIITPKSDTLDITSKQEKRYNRFYKNLDNSKASQYQMLNKKPENQYSELKQSNRDAQVNLIEKPKDSIQSKKKKK